MPSASCSAFLIATYAGTSASPAYGRRRKPAGSTPGTCAWNLIGLAHPLQTAGPLGVAFGAAEDPYPERDEDDRHHQQRPDAVEHVCCRRAVHQAAPHAVEHVGP